MIKNCFFTSISVIALFASVSFAQESTGQNSASPQGQGGQPRHHHAPSQAAISACSGKSEGDACSFTNSRNQSVSGTCAKTQNSQNLFCKGALKTSS